ncbi:uncharacterized protein LOC125532036 isoform X3 [Triticum urartu]|uniref:Uncharacterized protein n=1 Tax=Triticum urartu TaxID=4572 RepID=A0A8R7UCY2_TRIUA|nr:uncharacterized protein LOC125508222 isoform X3 [Triticum urartu]XP_048552169.1 uncharacterized protein LOC125532036 isoform X3 [Triticum urartu]
MWRGRSQEDLKDELTLGGELTLNLWRCIHHMLSQKEKIIYCGWLDRFRGIFDPRFVASAQLNYNCVSVHPVDHMKLIFLTFPLQEELCRDAGETNWDYISTMMHPDVMGCRIDWVKKFMFLVNFMDCWPLYILDTEKKIMIVHEMTETDPACEMKIKHEALAKKFQHRFCTLFNDMFGAGLVETRGLSFVYPLVAQHGQCSRQWSVYLALLRRVHQTLPTINTNPGSDRALAQEVCLRNSDHEGKQWGYSGALTRHNH